MTEQDLLTAMATTGRAVTSRTIKEWRQCGLLPDLVSQSRGLRKGRICFWPDDAIFDRVALIHDLLQDQTPKSEVYCLLWLCGISVPLPHLRRAWMQNAKGGEPWKMNGVIASWTPQLQNSIATAFGIDGGTSPQAQSNLLLQSTLMACCSLGESNAPEIDDLIAALSGLFDANTQADRDGSFAAERTIVVLLKSVWSAVRSSDLMSVAMGAELREAQTYAAMALRALQRSTRSNVDIYRSRNGTPAWPIAEARAFGTPLFIFVLLMVRSGQRALLEKALAELSWIARGESASAAMGCSAQRPTPLSRPLELT